MNKSFVLNLIFLICSSFVFCEKNELKVLHLSFHKGCINELQNIAAALSLNMESIFIPDLLHYFFDPQSYGNKLYNMGHARAKRIWEKHKDYFEKFDVIITSDTVPLARIFLQNNFKNHLIIWVCNRFDYCDTASLDCDFPDHTYYDLIKNAAKQNNVTLIAYSPFEKYYAFNKGIDIGQLTIKPCGFIVNKQVETFIPNDINKNETFFIPAYHNNVLFMNLSNKCKNLGIKNYCGKYNGPADLKGFKGIINLPGAWSNFAFFENLQLGIAYFVPSINFINTLNEQGNYFIPDSNYFFDLKQYELSDWYAKENKDLITYFDSWNDLKNKIENTDFIDLNKKINRFMQKHKKEMIYRWGSVFAKIKNISL